MLIVEMGLVQQSPHKYAAKIYIKGRVLSPRCRKTSSRDCLQTLKQITREQGGHGANLQTDPDVVVSESSCSGRRRGREDGKLQREKKFGPH